MKILLIVGAVFLYLIIGIILSYILQGNVNSEFKITDDDLNSMYVLLWPIIILITILLIIGYYGAILFIKIYRGIKK